MYFCWKCFCYLQSEGYEETDCKVKSERAGFAVLKSLGEGGVVGNLEVAAVRLGSGCLGTSLSFRRSERPISQLRKDSILLFFFPFIFISWSLITLQTAFLRNVFE